MHAYDSVRFCDACSVMTAISRLEVFHLAFSNLLRSTLSTARTDQIDHGSRDRLSAWLPLAFWRCGSVVCRPCLETFARSRLLMQAPSSDRPMGGNGVPHRNGATRAEQACWSIANCWSRDSLTATTRGTAVRPRANGGAVKSPSSNEALPGRMFGR